MQSSISVLVKYRSTVATKDFVTFQNWFQDLLMCTLVHKELCTLVHKKVRMFKTHFNAKKMLFFGCIFMYIFIYSKIQRLHVVVPLYIEL